MFNELVNCMNEFHDKQLMWVIHSIKIKMICFCILIPSKSHVNIYLSDFICPYGYDMYQYDKMTWVTYSIGWPRLHLSRVTKLLV